MEYIEYDWAAADFFQHEYAIDLAMDNHSVACKQLPLATSEADMFLLYVKVVN